MHDFLDSHQPPSTAMNSAKSAQIIAAMDQSDSQDVVNYAAAARATEVHRTTLARRYRSETVSRAEANSTYRQRLNDV